MSAFETYPEHPLFDAVANKAIDLAEQSAVKNGKDIPVGAIALFGAAIVGRGYASDGDEAGLDHMHAELVALKDAGNSLKNSFPAKTIVSSVEPCELCQEAIALDENITTVVFVTPRTELADRGLVNHRQSIEERAARFELPYNVVRLDNPNVKQRALEPFNYTTRDLTTGETKVDSDGFRAHIAQRIR